MNIFSFGILFFNNTLITLGKNSYHSLGTPNFTIIFHYKNVLNIFSMLLIDVIWWCWDENMPPNETCHICVDMMINETSCLDKDKKSSSSSFLWSLQNHINPPFLTKVVVPFKSPLTFYVVAIHHSLQKWWFHPSPH